jgi:methionyl-tRNA formyltransferase
VIGKTCFIGSKQIGLRALQTMCATVPGSVSQIVTFDDSSDQRSCLTEFKEFAGEANVPLEVLGRPQQLKKLLEATSPKLCVVVGWYWILKPEVLAIPPAGFVGAHASLLPHHRGGAPLVWSIIKGEEQGGITLFYFDEGMDNGDIIARNRFPIEKDDTIADAAGKAEAGLAELLSEFYPLLLQGKAPRHPQPHAEATYCSQRRPEDGRIDWQQDSKTIYDFVRAQGRPYPGAFTTVGGGQRIHIWKVAPFPNDYTGPPGRVVQRGDDHVVVTCGQGALLVHEVEINDWGPTVAPEILQMGAQLR